MSFSEQISPFFGRCAFVCFYASVIGDIFHNFHAISLQLDAKNVPLAPLLMVIAVVLLVLGCLSLLLGYHTRHGAVLLFGLTIASAVMIHDFWHLPEGAARAAEFAIFARDFAICGGLLMMVGMGAGPFAIDNKPPKGKKR